VTFQAYLDSIREKTGLGPDDFRTLATARGLLDDGVKVQQIVDWLKDDFDLGRGHAMALVNTFKERKPNAARVDALFGGARAHWRATFDDLVAALETHGPIVLAPTDTYVSLLKGKAKFAIIAVTADRLDVGIKFVDAPANVRLEPSGSWNAMVSHRVRITDPARADAELLDWLHRAYDAA
jgi:hypothetical protein